LSKRVSGKAICQATILVIYGNTILYGVWCNIKLIGVIVLFKVKIYMADINVEETLSEVKRLLHNLTSQNFNNTMSLKISKYSVIKNKHGLRIQSRSDTTGWVQ
jgi:hypothetical protein